jgi:hypothetical protein
LHLVLLRGSERGAGFAALVEELDSRGIAFNEYAGVELDSRLALEALREHRGAALYVICQDAQVDDFCAPFLKDLLMRTGWVDARQVVRMELRRDRIGVQARALALQARLAHPSRSSGATPAD